MADFSFVVPVYKVPYNFLQNCIDSILNQTHENIELVLVDDGSPDECGKICDDNATKDKRVVVIHKKNGGLSDARNSGTLVATSDWITFVDGDDWVDTDFVELFLKRISCQEIKADFYMYNGYRNYSDKEMVCTEYYQDGSRFETYEDRECLQMECCLVPTRNNGDQLFIGSGWAKVFNRKHLVKNNLFFKIVPYGEDSIFFMYVVEESNTIEYVSEPVYHYRDTEGGMVNGFRKNADKEQDIYTEALFEFAKEYNKKDSFIDILYLRVFISMQRIVSQKFFNPHNPDGLFKRWRDCIANFSKKPYADVYSRINFNSLNRNSKIKFVLFRLHLYGLQNIIRNLYNISLGKTNVKNSRME